MAAEKSPQHPADAVVAKYDIFELIHFLRLPNTAFSEKKKAEAQEKLLKLFDEENCSGWYQKCCDEFGWAPEPERLARYNTENEKIYGELTRAVEEAQAQYGDSELKDAKMAVAHHLCRIGKVEDAKERYEDLLSSKNVESTAKVNILLTFIRLSMFDRDGRLTAEYIERADKQFAVGGDWETRNRMRIYKALHLAMNERKFDKAADLLISGLATFTATELLSFNHFIQLTVLLSMVSLPRPVLLTKVAKSPEVLQVLAEDPVLDRFFNSFMTCNYKAFFQNFVEATNRIRVDRFVSPHYRVYVRRMRLVAYQQYLKPYKSVTIPAMAKAFGVPPKFIEEQVVSFIPCGMLKGRVDEVEGTIMSAVENENATLYLEVLKSGDALINELQMLSKVIDM